MQQVTLASVRVNDTDLHGALDWVEQHLRDGRPGYACFCEASLLSNVPCNAEVAQALERADAVFADGIALMMLARLAGHPLPGRVPGPSFLPAACECGLARGWRHFFYGGAPGVAERLAERLRERYAGLCVVGAYSPPFRALTDAEEVEVKRRIEASGAHLLWVCLGSPKQELWVAEHLGKINVPLMLPVGAAFDFHSGNRPWAPVWLRKLGLEWAYRTCTGGRRTFARNLRCVTVVAGILAKAALRRVMRKPV